MQFIRSFVPDVKNWTSLHSASQVHISDDGMVATVFCAEGPACNRLVNLAMRPERGARPGFKQRGMRILSPHGSPESGGRMLRR